MTGWGEGQSTMKGSIFKGRAQAESDGPQLSSKRSIMDQSKHVIACVGTDMIDLSDVAVLEKGTIRRLDDRLDSVGSGLIVNMLVAEAVPVFSDGVCRHNGCGSIAPIDVSVVLVGLMDGISVVEQTVQVGNSETVNGEPRRYHFVRGIGDFDCRTRSGRNEPLAGGLI
jgi:hypothetical protein